MKVRNVNERTVTIEFSHSEMQLLSDIEKLEAVSPIEVVENSLEETLRLKARIRKSEKKLRKAVEKFNTENQMQIGLDDMRALVNKCRL